MNNPRLLAKLNRSMSKFSIQVASMTSSSKDRSTTTNRSEHTEMKKESSSVGRDNFSQLKGILMNMKTTTSQKNNLYNELKKYGNSALFNYATNQKFDQNELKTQQLEVWNKLYKRSIKRALNNLPANGFEELILLTEQGKLWKFPIDNEQGMEAEQQVPFEDHIFLDQYLEEFPKNEYIQTFMEFVIAGLARNYWMTVDRKREIIKFYKEYFESKREVYKESGFDL